MFLEDLANDIHICHTTGLIVSKQLYFYDLEYIVADAPARSKLTYTLGHGTLKNCPFCSKIGFKNARIGTQYASEIVLPLRTDESFRLRIDENNFHKSHRKRKGVLEKFGVPMVSKVVQYGINSSDHGIMRKKTSRLFLRKKVSQDI